ncbi:hypothetical protein BC940DRAFT_178 [Gongronella butleri]|nr:hypothetical protein BC940DRAFT_178 [Gongronella butleri]
MAMANRRSAPSTIFATTKQSPRQIALKTFSLGCKKLDRDDRRSRPQYNVRERLLLCNMINQAEEVLNKRARRTNRRVMEAEDDDSHFDANLHTGTAEHVKHFQEHQKYLHEEHHSPLRDSEIADDEEEDDETAIDNPPNDTTSSSAPSTRPTTPVLSTSSSSTSLSDSYMDSSVLPDCRRMVKHSPPSPHPPPLLPIASFEME